MSEREQFEKWLDDFLAEFSPNNQERILQYAIDHVVPKLKGRRAQTAQAVPLHQARTDPENQPNQYGVEFLMHGSKFAFKVGNRQFTLDYEPTEPGEFEFMRDMLINAFSTFTPDVKTAQAVRSKLGAGVGWIACEDQMPEPGTECLVRVKALSPTQSGPTHYTHIDTWDEQHEAPVSWSSATIPVGLGWDSFDFEDVTHWQPLPPPSIVGKEGA